jgi:hypothetical protein
VEGVGGVGLEYLEPSGGVGGSFDEAESCGGVEQAGLQDLGLPVLLPRSGLCWPTTRCCSGKGWPGPQGDVARWGRSCVLSRG